jgi:VWFA-related protein
MKGPGAWGLGRGAGGLGRGLGLAVALAVASGANTQAQQPVFRSGIDVVSIDVSVMNGNSAVSGLTIDKFVVTDNGVPQTLDSISLDKVPLSLMLVLDTSGSLEGERLQRLIEATTDLVRALKPEDAAALLQFSEPIRLAVPMTANRAPLLEAISRLEAKGATTLNDAVFFGLQLRPMDAAASRPVVLVFSDGHDTSSWLSDEHVLEATRRSGAIVHVVELVPDMYSRQSPFLGRLAASGGGRRWLAASPNDLRNLFGRVLDELRARYLLTYYPTGVAAEGWHDVKVTLKGARGDVTARPGYYVPPR